MNTRGADTSNELHEITQAWNADNVTYDPAPDYAASPAAQIADISKANTVYGSADLSTPIASWQSGSIHGLTLVPNASGDGKNEFASMEYSGGGSGAYLSINYTP